MSKKLFLIIVITVLIIITTTGIVIYFNSKQNEDKLEEKLEAELDFIGRELVNMANSLNNIKYNNYSLQVNKENSLEENDKDKSKENDKSEEESTNSDQSKELTTNYIVEEKGILNTNLNDLDWDYLKNNIERLYNIWTTTIIDLNSANINNNDILSFSNILDYTTISAKNEDKTAVLNNLASLYSYIPTFLSQIKSDNKKIQLSKTINSLLNSYVFVNQNDWDSAEINIEESIASYMQIINNVDEKSKYSQNKVTRIYVLLNELKNSILLNDKEIYFIKYKNLLEELINL